jgi:large subunit ribosomal protein L18
MKNRQKEKRIRRLRRHVRVRAKIFGTAQRPRLSVFRSNNHIYAQLIDDTTGRTLLAVSDLNLKINKQMKKTNIAAMVGESLAKLAKEHNIKRVVFDRGGYSYHGRVKALAEAARKGGLIF